MPRNFKPDYRTYLQYRKEFWRQKLADEERRRQIFGE